MHSLFTWMNIYIASDHDFPFVFRGLYNTHFTMLCYFMTTRVHISPCCQGCGGSGGGDRSSGEQRSISTGETNSGSLSSHGGELSQ